MDMKYTMKKVYALLLTIVMLVNIFPVSAFAGTDEVRIGSFNLGNAKSAGDAYHTVKISVASDVSWGDGNHLYFVLKQE